MKLNFICNHTADACVHNMIQLMQDTPSQLCAASVCYPFGIFVKNSDSPATKPIKLRNFTYSQLHKSYTLNGKHWGCKCNGKISLSKNWVPILVYPYLLKGFPMFP